MNIKFRSAKEQKSTSKKEKSLMLFCSFALKTPTSPLPFSGNLLRKALKN
jgi:hypothetical protein